MTSVPITVDVSLLAAGSWAGGVYIPPAVLPDCGAAGEESGSKRDLLANTCADCCGVLVNTLSASR